MSKLLKIGGVVLIVVIAVVAIIVTMLSQALTGGNKHTALTDDSGSTSSFASPLSLGSIGSRNAVESETIAVAPSMGRGMKYAPSNDFSQTERKVVKNGDLSLKIDNADEAQKKIQGIAKNNGGEIFASNFYQNGNHIKSGTITVKVPVTSFEKTLSEIKGIASLVLRESTSGQDVTEEYTDLQAQLRNAIVEEQTFTRILDQAQKIDDVLAVTRELSRVRGTIEQLQGRMKYLDAQTDMSTISISLTENQSITIADSWRPVQIVKESVNSLIKGLQGFVDFVIRFFIVILPFLLIWGAIFWFLYRIGKKVYLRMKASDTPQN